MTTGTPLPDDPGGSRLLLQKTRSAIHFATYRGERAWKRFTNSAKKTGRHYTVRAKHFRCVVVEKIKNGTHRGYNLSRLALRRVARLHKPFVRTWKRSMRVREARVSRRVEYRAKRRVLTVARSRRPLIIGPWFSEVGFEVLYWVPFLNWLQAETNFDPENTVVVSRGGVAAWYGDLASRYVEIFDVLEPEIFARRNLERREMGDGSHKQLGLSLLDQEILDVVTTRLGLVNPKVCHPSLMYQLLRNFWLGHRSLTHVEDYTRHKRVSISSRFDLAELPAEYVAVKLYTAASLPDRADTQRLLRAFIGKIAERIPVVMLNTGLRVDDHQDYLFDQHENMVNLSRWMTPKNNLGLQTEVISRARIFVGTCGSLTWLAPLLGVNTVAIMSDPRFLHPHLYLARKVYLEAQAGRFSTVDLRGLVDLGLEPLIGERVTRDGQAMKASIH